MKVVNLTIVKLSICLVLGILAAHFFSTHFLLLVPLIGGCLLLAVLWLVGRNQLRPSILFGIAALFLFFGIGFVNYQLRLPKHRIHHFTHFSESGKSQTLQLKVVEQLKSDNYNDKFLATVQMVERKATVGRILIYVEKDSTSASIQLDHQLVAYAVMEAIPEMLNPHQFDYKKYMQTLGVYAQIRLSKTEVFLIDEGSTTMRGRSERIRNYATQQLTKTSIGIDELAILQALVLGQKRDVSTDLKQKYADAGAIHILAVSGLHVGVLFLIFNFLSYPFSRLPFGRIIQPLLVLLALWGFAFLTGLSPSVSRAVTMFSFLAVAQHLGRHTYTMNTLFLSFLFLLLLEPLWLFHVGFQLSYLAVFFIVWVQPKFAALWRPHFKVVRLFWGIVTVSISAQLGVLPLSLYYFHQLPGLFLLSNLVILPVLGILLGLGLLFILMACANIVPDWMTQTYGLLLQKLNAFITWVAAQNDFIIKDISFSMVQTFICYLLIIAFVLIWKRFTYRRIMFLLIAVCISIVALVWVELNQAGSELVIFQKSRSTLIGIIHGKQMTLLKPDSLSYKSSYPIKNYLVSKHIDEIKEQTLPGIFNYGRNTFLIIDSLGVYPKSKNIDYILLSNSPKVNLQRLVDSLDPLLIVADGSNYYSYVKRWKTTCEQAQTPFHHTKEKGAFVITKNPN